MAKLRKFILKSIIIVKKTKEKSTNRSSCVKGKEKLNIVFWRDRISH